ncbi:11624_t:CDS:2, partial [Scutellospora calospora]
ISESSILLIKEGITLGEELYQNNIISVPFLLDVVATYGRSNIKQIEKFLDNIIKSIIKLLQDFENHSIIIINYIKVINEQFQEMVDNEMTSKSVITNAFTYLEYILDISVTLDCLFIVSKPVANIFNNRQDFEDKNIFLTTIENLYDITIPIISKIFKSTQGTLNISRDLIILKHALVSLAYNTLDACYFSPIGFTANKDEVYSFIKSDDKLEDIDDKVEKMGDVLLWFIEFSQLDKPVESFVDAPLLLDIEIEFDLNYVVGHLELLRNMNQESGKLPWQIRLEEKQRRHFDMQRISLISQVQEVLPDLGEGFIEECLIAFDNNVEVVIDRLLQNSLPDHLNELDRSMTRRVVTMTNDSPKKEESLLSQRQNIFDNDEFDIFSGKSIDFKRVNKGKKNRGTADNLLEDKSFVKSHKDSIINIANDMMYEDEYDDTYDTSGLKMGGIDLHMIDEIDEETEINNSVHGKVDPSITHESELIKTIQSDPTVFDRTNAVRKSDKRARLRNITHMTDEQLEGWKDKLLEKYDFRNNQEEASSSTSEKETSSSRDSSPQPGKGKGNYSNNFNGESSQKNNTATGTAPPTARGRGRGKNRGRNANHDRKNARAKKMGKGFGAIHD